MAGDQEVFHRGPEMREPSAPPAGPPRVDKGRIRESIADVARTFVASGHYLEGTAGNTPGGADGNPGGDKRDHCKLLPPTLDTDLRETRPGKVLSVCTAMQDKFKKFNSCAGRSERFPQPPASAVNEYL